MRRMLGNTTFTLVLVGAAFFAGLMLGGKPETEAMTKSWLAGGDAPTDVDLAPIWKAWNLLDTKFVPTGSSTRVSDEKKVYGMIEGLAKAYGDPYTVFMPPEESSMFEEDISGQFGGVGMEIGMRNGLITVIAPLKSTPAQAAGILTGDVILEIDGTSTKDMSVDAAVRNIRGEVGTKVTFTIAREGEKELLTKNVTRDVIKIPTIDTKLREDGIFVINLYNFGATAPGEFRNALRAFMLSGSQKLIIDLRNDPGGYLEASTDIASWFLPAGEVVVTEDFGDKEASTIHRSKGYNVYKSSWKVVLLVNEGSASASEILAGALREHKRAVLIGTKTFGKGSVQELIKVTPDTSLKVTIARWLTPHGISISQNGLEPDIKVERTADDIEKGKDPQLDAAVKYLLGK